MKCKTKEIDESRSRIRFKEMQMKSDVGRSGESKQEGERAKRFLAFVSERLRRQKNKKIEKIRKGIWKKAGVRTARLRTQGAEVP